MFQLLKETGFRLDDILSIRLWEAKKALERNELTLREHKTAKSRTVALSDAARTALRHLTTYRASSHPLGYLLPTMRQRNKRKVHRTTIYKNWRDAVSRVNLDRADEVTVHSIRKLYARNLYDRTRSLIAVQHDLNHRYKSTTLLYVTDIRD